MPPVDRKNPIRAQSSESDYTFLEFVREYPDDDACLEFLWRSRYSPDGEFAFCTKCERSRPFKRYATKQRRQSWTCTACGHHIQPTAGTIFEKSSTSLQLWFFAIYIMSSTRCGVSAKQLERELGVTYKTAWRMFTKIRNQLMAQDATPLQGAVEADETFVGGKPRANRPMPKNAHWDRKAMVFAAVERGGRVRAEVVPNSRAVVVQPKVREYVESGSTLYTDEFHAYKALGRDGEYEHRAISHSDRVYARGDVHTQSVEGFFALLKNAIRGVHHGVSREWLQGYVNEYAFRWNHSSATGEDMFRSLLSSAASGR